MRAVAANLLEAEALVISGLAIDTKAVGDALRGSAEVLGGESWRLTARLARLTQNAGWSELAERQLANLIGASGSYAAKVRAFAEHYQERLTEAE